MRGVNSVRMKACKCRIIAVAIKGLFGCPFNKNKYCAGFYAFNRRLT